MQEKRTVIAKTIMNDPLEWDDDLAAGEKSLKCIRDKMAAKAHKGIRFRIEFEGAYMQLVCYQEMDFEG